MKRVGDSGPGIELVVCLIGEGLKPSHEGVHFSWSEMEMTEFLFCTFCSASVLECLFEGIGYGSPEVFICGEVSSIELINGPYGPVLDPVFDVLSLDEPQKKCGSFHGVVNLVCANIGQAIEVEFIHKGICFAASAIEYPRGIAP